MTRARAPPPPSSRLLAHVQVIDATNRGAISRFINHSCSPNCETQKWFVDGVRRIGIFTTRPVAKGEELTFDYKFRWFKGCVCMPHAGTPEPKNPAPCTGAHPWAAGCVGRGGRDGRKYPVLL